MKPILHANMRKLCLYWSIGLIVAGIIASIYTDETSRLIEGVLYIALTPDNFADYFAYASLGAALVNTGLCGLSVVLVAGWIGAEFNSAMIAAFFLVIGHGTLGKSVLNIWPCAIGTAIFYAAIKQNIKDRFYICITTSCFGPLISELLFRYTLDNFNLTGPVVTLQSFLIMILMSLIIGALFPGFLRLSLKLNRGYTLFNAGMGGGLLALLLYFILYVLLAHDFPYGLVHNNPTYSRYSHSYILSVNAIMIIMCSLTVFRGYRLNGQSLRGYRELFFNKSGNILEKYGEALSIINIGISGLYMLMVYDFLILSDASGEGAGFTGMTTGALIASMSFAAGAETPACTWPVILGYVLQTAMRTLTGDAWNPALQSNLSSLAFAIGMCPIVLRRGWFWGVLAGMLCSFIVPIMPVFNGGLMLYNSGFTTGIIAMLFAIFFGINDRLREIIAQRHASMSWKKSFDITA